METTSKTLLGNKNTTILKCENRYGDWYSVCIAYNDNIRQLYDFDTLEQAKDKFSKLTGIKLNNEIQI